MMIGAVLFKVPTTPPPLGHEIHCQLPWPSTEANRITTATAGDATHDDLGDHFLIFLHMKAANPVISDFLSCVVQHVYNICNC